MDSSNCRGHIMQTREFRDINNAQEHQGDCEDAVLRRNLVSFVCYMADEKDSSYHIKFVNSIKCLSWQRLWAELITNKAYSMAR